MHEGRSGPYQRTFMYLVAGLAAWSAGATAAGVENERTRVAAIREAAEQAEAHRNGPAKLIRTKLTYMEEHPDVISPSSLKVEFRDPNSQALRSTE